ncbi:MAG TPA: hypothetical protein VF796_24875 [Humisphaera sp.]
MNPSDVQDLFLETLGLRLGDEMTDYLVRRFQEGGAAAVPVAYVPPAAEALPAPVRRFVELQGVLGHGSAVPADGSEPQVH